MRFKDVDDVPSGAFRGKSRLPRIQVCREKKVVYDHVTVPFAN